MKYMLMMHAPAGPYRVDHWTPEDFRGHVAFMRDFAERLAAQGELLSAQGLAPPDQAVRVRAGEDALPLTDGVFPETKEFLAGFWLVEVPDAARAHAIAAEASAAPGPGGAPLRMAIEVREVMSAPPPEG